MLNLWGPSSWFGGPHDKTTGPTTASGASTSQPGIAVNNRSTLGGYWLIKIGSSVGIVKQTDIGPAPSTGRKFDYTYSLLPLFGYSQQNFPTGAQTYGIYLGKNPAALSGPVAHSAFDTIGATPGQIATLTQAIDAGAINQGQTAVVAPSGQKAGTTLPGQGQIPSGSEATPGGIPIPGLPDWEHAVAKFFSDITSPSIWKRVLYFLAGAAFVFWGIKELTGAQIPALKVAP